MKNAYNHTAPLDTEIMEVVKEGFIVKEKNEENGALIVEPKFTDEESFELVRKKLVEKEIYPFYRQEKDGLVLRIGARKGKRREMRPLFHTILLILTVFTVTVAGYIWWAGGNTVNSILFTIGLMGILGGHELGHALVARKNGVDATLPFFLPVPPIFAFGTLGAVIFMNSPIPNRKSLFDIGVAGPITGFILSIPILIIGISLSNFVPFDSAHTGPFMLGTPILFNFLANLILGSPADGMILLAHPLAIAGWAGIFVTALNLLPMGQLDGGHVVRAVFSKKSSAIYRWVYRVLFIMGTVGVISVILELEDLTMITWPGWLFWAVLVYFMTRLEHPGPLNDVTPLDKSRMLASIAMLIIFIISFTPVPVASV